MFKSDGLLGFAPVEGSPERKPKPRLPPRDGDEWLTREGLASVFPEVPDSVVHQHKLDYHADTLVGTEEEIAETLTGKLELDFSDLERLSADLERLLEEISNLHLLNAPTQSTRTRLAQGEMSYDAASSQGGASARTAMSKGKFRGHSLEVVEQNPSDLPKTNPAPGRGRPGHRRGRPGEQSRGIASVKFPGFVKDEPASLPAVVEAPELLSKPVFHLDLPDDFRRQWKHVMTSEMSVLLLQDCFWWLFLEHFNPSPHDQDKLFGRISDTFVCMLESTALSKFKGDVFMLYPHCLAQSLLFAFCRMFPMSRSLFDDDFRTEVADLIWRWIAGMTCPVQYHWRNWPLDELGANRLLAPVPSAVEAMAHTSALKALAIANPDGGDVSRSSAGGTKRTAPPPPLQARASGCDVRSASRRRSQAARPTSGILSRVGTPGDLSSVTETTSSSSSSVGTAADTHLSRPSTAPPVPALSQFHNIEEQLATDKWVTQFTRKEQEARVESYPIREGAEYQWVVFDMMGRSPLVDHYLKMHKQLGKRTQTMLRTEIKPNLDTERKKTFNDALVETRSVAKRLDETYRKAVAEHAERNAELKAEYATAKKFIERDAKEKCQEILRRRRAAASQNTLPR